MSEGGGERRFICSSLEERAASGGAGVERGRVGGAEERRSICVVSIHRLFFLPSGGFI